MKVLIGIVFAFLTTGTVASDDEKKSSENVASEAKNIVKGNF
jgi:hypothetical protein